MKDWIMRVIGMAGRKAWEYGLFLSLLLNVYLLAFGGCWEQVADKFGFTNDIRDILSKKAEEYTKELPRVLEINSKP